MKIVNSYYGSQKIVKIFTLDDFPTEVGEEYGGGKVAYLGSEGDFVNGMVCATEDTSTGYQWGCRNTTIGGDAVGTAIGTGAKATAAIVAGCSTDAAAKLCDDLLLNGYTDWFLPSLMELNELYQNKDIIGGFSAASYWSSSEDSSTIARRQGFDSGNFINTGKNNFQRVRAVRGFAINYTPQYIYQEQEPLPEIGDEHEGGIVAYLGSEGDFENGMISTTADTSEGYQWGCRGTLIGGDAAGTAIGTGAKATAAIVAGCSTDAAARLCDNLSLNGYTDWFLPSLDELNELYQNKTIIGGFSNADHWSSSEHSSTHARQQYFLNGAIFNRSKNYVNRRVRAVRGF